MYEYSRHDTENRVDMAAFYHEDMWTSGVLTQDSRELLSQYGGIPLATFKNIKMGLEFDCGSVKPAIFSKLNPGNPDFNRALLYSQASIVGLGNIDYPQLSERLTIEDIGIFPERATAKIRVLVRGPAESLRQHVIDNGMADSPVFEQLKSDQFGHYGLNFDWDGITGSNYALHGSTLAVDDLWVKSSRQHCEDNVARMFGDNKYTVTQFVKIGLSNNFAPNYMKAYFTVRRTG